MDTAIKVSEVRASRGPAWFAEAFKLFRATDAVEIADRDGQLAGGLVFLMRVTQIRGPST